MLLMKTSPFTGHYCHRQPVASAVVKPLKSNCDSTTRHPDWEMTLTWTGTQTSFNDAAIETDVPGFGIELQHDGQRFKLNTPLAINATDFTQKPKLEAVPVKASDAVLSDTNFSAYATLRVDYQ